MAWRPARSLMVLRDQLVPLAPGAPPGSFGFIGDQAHAAKKSDHNPADFPGWGSQIVTATDFPDMELLDARAVLDSIRLSRDRRVKYGISHGQMFSSYYSGIYPAWTWRPYTGADQHFTHGHLSVVGDARADDETLWKITGTATSTTVSTTASGGTEMSGEADAAFIKPWPGSGPWISSHSWMAQAVEAPLRSLKADVAELRGRAVAAVAPIDVSALAKALANEPTFVDALVRGITAAAEAGAARALEHTHLVVGGPPDGT